MRPCQFFSDIQVTFFSQDNARIIISYDYILTFLRGKLDQPHWVENPTS